MEIEIRPTDILFGDSPNSGDPECKCSRCSKTIPEGDIPLRAFVEPNNEYRYCTECQEGMGFTFSRYPPINQFD